MNTLMSSLDYSGLIRILEGQYRLKITKIHLYRDMIGFVYIVEDSLRKYVLKLFRPFNKSQALQSIDIIQYLNSQDYPVAAIVQTDKEDQYFDVNLPEGKSVGVLFDYIDGIEADSETDIMSIGQQVGKLHNIMDKYPNPLASRGKDFYIDRFIDILKNIKYSSSKTAELEDYGHLLWNTMTQLPIGFCHGDLHTGNMLKTKAGSYALFDFDVASRTHSIIDVAVLSDATNFNRLAESAYGGTRRRFESFYEGYCRERTVSNGEFKAIFDFIAIRHYELIATIAECQGYECLNTDFLDEQHDWLKRWRRICERS